MFDVRAVATVLQTVVTQPFCPADLLTAYARESEQVIKAAL